MADDMLQTTGKQITPMEAAKQMVKLEKLKKEVDVKLRDLKQYLLVTMKDLDVLTLKTGTYTLSRRTWKKAMVQDDDKAIAFLEKAQIPVETKTVLDMDFMKTPLDNLMKDGVQVDGVEYKETEYVLSNLGIDNLI